MVTPQPSQPRRTRNLSLSAAAGLAGCVSVIVVFTALFVGLWLDSQLGQRGPCTVGLIVASVPVSLTLMVRIALLAIKRLDPSATATEPTQTSEEV